MVLSDTCCKGVNWSDIVKRWIPITRGNIRTEYARSEVSAALLLTFQVFDMCRCCVVWHAVHDVSTKRISFHLQHQAVQDVLKYFNCLNKVLRLGIGSTVHVYDTKRRGHIRRRLWRRGKWEVKDEEGGRGTGPQRASDRWCFFPPGANSGWTFNWQPATV